jgi:hypothetical protein
VRAFPRIREQRCTLRSARYRADSHDSRVIHSPGNCLCRASLEAACPRKVYSEFDVEYGERIRVSSQIVSAVILDLEQRLGKLRMIEAFREFVRPFLVSCSRSYMN